MLFPLFVKSFLNASRQESGVRCQVSESRSQKVEGRGQDRFIRELENWKIGKLVKEVSYSQITLYRLLFTNYLIN
jgi:hypothetical protein